MRETNWAPAMPYTRHHNSLWGYNLPKSDYTSVMFSFLHQPSLELVCTCTHTHTHTQRHTPYKSLEGKIICFFHPFFPSNSSRGSYKVGGQNNPLLPPKMSRSRSLEWICHLILQKGCWQCDGVKDFEMGRLPWIMWMDPIQSQGSFKEQRRRYDHRGRVRELRRWYTAGSEDAGRGKSQGMQEALRSWKRPGNSSSPRAPGMNRALPTPCERHLGLLSCRNVS